MPTTAKRATRPAVGWALTATASHCFARDTVAALSDGTEPANSTDGGRPRFSWWDRKGSAEWVEYAFDQPRAVSAASVYWWDDARAGGGCRTPTSWRLLCRAADGSWQPVPGRPTFGTEPDADNVARFDPVTTTGLRLEAQLRPNVSAGILRWRVFPD